MLVKDRLFIEALLNSCSLRFRDCDNEFVAYEFGKVFRTV